MQRGVERTYDQKLALRAIGDARHRVRLGQCGLREQRRELRRGAARLRRPPARFTRFTNRIACVFAVSPAISSNNRASCVQPTMTSPDAPSANAASSFWRASCGSRRRGRSSARASPSASTGAVPLHEHRCSCLVCNVIGSHSGAATGMAGGGSAASPVACQRRGVLPSLRLRVPLRVGWCFRDRRRLNGRVLDVTLLVYARLRRIEQKFRMGSWSITSGGIGSNFV